MRVVAVALLMAGSAAFAQRPNPNPTGFGSVLYPGTGGPPPARVPNGGFGSVLYPGTGGPPGRNAVPRNVIAPPRVPHAAHPATVIVPVPVYYGGFYADPNGYGQQPAPAYEDPNLYNGQAPPVVVINQAVPGYGQPPDYSYAPQQQQQDVDQNAPRQDMPATIYLIALTDHSILPTIAYWVEGGDTVAYITTEGDQNRISLALVDREFSKKLNDDRHVEFKLPKQ